MFVSQSNQTRKCCAHVVGSAGQCTCVHKISILTNLMLLQVGVYNELSLKRLDLVVAQAAANNIYLILPFVNYWPDLGGMQ